MHPYRPTLVIGMVLSAIGVIAKTCAERPPEACHESVTRFTATSDPVHCPAGAWTSIEHTQGESGIVRCLCSVPNENARSVFGDGGVR